MPPDPPRRQGLTPAYYSSTICLLQILLKTLGKIEMLYNFFASFYLKMRFEINYLISINQAKNSNLDYNMHTCTFLS